MVKERVPFHVADCVTSHDCVSFNVRDGASETTVEYRLPAGMSGDCGNAMLAATLVPAMQSGGALRIDAPVSKRMLASVAKIQDILRGWYPELRRVRVAAKPFDAPRDPPGRKVAAFFSGGVDSFYTLRRQADEIAMLVFVRGFDLRDLNSALTARVTASVAEMANELGKELVIVDTNVRDFGNEYVDWGEHLHGAALASVAHQLAAQVKRIYIPSTDDDRHLHPWGSHPLLDPLWSSESLEIVHDGCEASRLEKIESLAQDDVALRSLRVCWRNDGDAYNCGRCEKCFQTMVALEVVDALDRCATFGPLDPSVAASMSLGTVWWYEHEENLDALRRRGKSQDLIDAVETVLARLHSTL